jgi:hypothetical protein
MALAFSSGVSIEMSSNQPGIKCRERNRGITDVRPPHIRPAENWLRCEITCWRIDIQCILMRNISTVAAAEMK